MVILAIIIKPYRHLKQITNIQNNITQSIYKILIGMKVVFGKPIDEKLFGRERQNRDNIGEKIDQPKEVSRGKSEMSAIRCLSHPFDSRH